MRHFAPLLLLALLSSPGAARGQSPEHAGFVAQLGRDTVAVESFTRSRDRLEGDLVTRSPETRLIHYVAELGADGAVTRLTVDARALNDLPGALKPFHAVVSFGDSVEVTMTQGDSTSTYGYTAPGAAPMVNWSYALWEQVIRQGTVAGKDSVSVPLVYMGRAQPFPNAVRRLGRDSVVVSYFGFPFYAHLDKNRRVISMDGSQTTVKVAVVRVAKIDAHAMGDQFAAREMAGQALGPLSPRDTVRAEISGAHLLVDYGRPARRGRTIFGQVVPWNEVWRTGANAATQFFTDRPLVVGGVEIPAGGYTLWTIPTQDGCTLIINSQTGQWGTQYDAGKDSARIPLEVSRMEDPMERFTIGIEAAASGGVLALGWDRTRYSVTFLVQ